MHKTHVAYRDASSRILSETTYTSSEEELSIVLLKNPKDPSKIGGMRATLTITNTEKYEELKSRFDYSSTDDMQQSIIFKDKYDLIQCITAHKLLTEEIQKDCYSLLNLPYYSWVSTVEKTETTNISFTPIRTSKIQKIVFDEKDFSALPIEKDALVETTSTSSTQTLGEISSQIETEQQTPPSISDSSAPTLEELASQIESEQKSTSSELIEKTSASTSSFHVESKLKSAFLTLYKTPKESDFDLPSHPFHYQDITLTINDPLDFETIKDKLSKYAFTLSRAEYPELEVRTIFIVEFLNTIAEYLVDIDEIQETLKTSYPNLYFKEWTNPLRIEEGEEAIRYVVKDEENEFLFKKFTLRYDKDDSISFNFHINSDCKLSTQEKLSHLLTLQGLLRDSSTLNVKRAFKEKRFLLRSAEKDIDLIRALRSTTLHKILPHCTEIEKFILGDGPKHIPRSLKEIISIHNTKYPNAHKKSHDFLFMGEVLDDSFYLANLRAREKYEYNEEAPTMGFDAAPAWAENVSQPAGETTPYHYLAPSPMEETSRSFDFTPTRTEEVSQPEREVTSPHCFAPSPMEETSRSFDFTPARAEEVAQPEREVPSPLFFAPCSIKEEEAKTPELLKCLQRGPR